MTSNGFWRGVFWGSLIGAAAAAFMAPQIRPETKQKWAARGHELRQRVQSSVGPKAGQLWHRTKEAVVVDTSERM